SSPPIFILGQRRAISSSARPGSGPPPPIFRIRVTNRSKARSANTTAVHVQSDGLARRLLRHSALSRPLDVPELLSAGDAMAIQRNPIGEVKPSIALPRRHDEHRPDAQ